MSSPRIRPFPWASLDATTPAEVQALRDAKRWAAGRLRLDEVGRALGATIGTAVDVRIGRARRLGPSPGEGWVGVGLCGADETSPGVVVEVEPALAGHVVALALQRPTRLTRNLPVAPGICGAFAAVLLAALRRGHGPGAVALRAAGAGPAAALETELRPQDADTWAISLTVVIGQDAFAARVVVPAGSAAGSPGLPWSIDTLRGLGHTPLALPIVACAFGVAASELATLRPGDALVPAPGGLRFGPGKCGLEGGRVWLSPDGSEVGVRAQLAEGCRLVLTGDLESIVSGETSMERDASGALVSVLGDLPVVVRVEIGEAAMSAREWASLSRGDVIALGKRLGDLVVLRVAGAPVARGELVQLDGEVAVRIAERLDDGASR